MGDARRRRIAAVAALALAVVIGGVGRGSDAAVQPLPATAPAPPTTDLGINLFGLAYYYREQVFADRLAQSEWFSSRGQGWTTMPADRLDARGWVRSLAPGEFAPRPLVLPPPGFAPLEVRCRFAGHGRLSAGGVAQMTGQGPGEATLLLVSQGKADDSGWIQIDATDPADPLRDIACRDRSAPPGMVFAPQFLATLSGFAAIRFLDWQRVNDNPASRWATRVRPSDGTQAGPGGVAIEHMVALANEARIDPWFVMPYGADDAYVESFARLVRDTIAPDRTVHVELGNEIWNDQFAAARQARAEGEAAGLAPGDPFRAQMRRYAQKAAAALAIWTRVFADRPGRLVRIVSSINAYPEAAEMILEQGEVAQLADALATAPYIHLPMEGRGPGEGAAIFAQLPAAIDETIALAERNRAIATRHGKRFIAYEGGQHLVTPDLALARRVQRDPRMAAVYARYLDRWRARIGDRMMLYASTAPIGEFGSWGLREYAGQPIAETPKLRAVQAFQARLR